MMRRENRRENNRVQKLVKRNKRRKARRAIESAILLSIFLFCVAFAGLKAGAISTNAQNTNPDGSEKQYKCVMVEQGDCLWDIADRYMGAGYSDIRAYIEEVKQINNLTGDDLHYGSYLCVPYYE